jgi:hypothetical protein
MNAPVDRATNETQAAAGSVRVDAAGDDPGDAKAQLRLRLLRMIVASELSRKAPPTESAKPR